MGPLSASIEEQALVLPKSKKARALIALVATAPKGIPKEQLCRLLFDTSADPRGSLRWALSRLRSSLGSSGSHYIISERRVRLSQSVATDVAQLSQVGHGLEHRQLADLVAVEQQVEGGFLDNLSLDDCPEFEAWRLAERARYQVKHAEILLRIIELISGTTEAVDYARRLVGLQPDSELAWSALISELSLAGDIKQARSVYSMAHRELAREGIPLRGLLREAIAVRETPGMAIVSAAARPPQVNDTGQRPTLQINPCRGSSSGGDLDPAGVPMALFVAASRIKSCTTFAPQAASSLHRLDNVQGDLILDSQLEPDAGQVLLRVNLLSGTGGAHLYGWELRLSTDAELSLFEQIAAYFSCHLEVDLTLALVSHALEKPEHERSARDLYHLALPRIYTAQGYDPRAALQALEAAIERAPTLAPALCAVAWVRNTIIEFNSQPEEVAVTSSLARRAVEFGQDDPFVLGWAAVVIAHTDLDLATAGDLVQRALSLNPHSPMALIGGSFVAHYAGDYDLSLTYVGLAEASGTAGPLAFLCYSCRAMSLYQLERWEDALAMADRALGHNPTFIVPLRYKAASLARLNRFEEALAVAASMTRLDPSERLTFFRGRSPYASAKALDELCEALQLAGLPD